MTRFALLFLILFSFQNQAFAFYATMSPSLRVYPIGATVEGLLGKDWYLYDERNPKEFWRFGLISLKAKGALHGLMDATLSVYPISFVKIYFGVGGTYRYYNSTGFNCNVNTCQGFLSRTNLGFSFVFSFGEQDEFMVIPNYNSVAVSHNVTNRPIVDETELLTAAGSGDTLDQVSLFCGKTLRKGNIFGIYFKQSQYRKSLKQNEMQLMVMNWDWKTTALSLGLGRYASDYHTPGITANIEYVWKWGEGLALF